MENRNEEQSEKFAEMADQKPRKALYYGMASVIIFLLSLNGMQYRNNLSLREDFQKREDAIRLEAKHEEKEQNKALIKMYADQHQQDKEDREADQKRIIEMSEKVETILSKSDNNGAKNKKVEAKLDNLFKETKKIEEVVLP